jgi:large conductance mechanosensitive channel
MSVVKEFKEFAVKGNVVDLAVGIIIGGAFGKIVSSLVGDVIMPPLGLLIGGVDFRDLSATLKAPLLGSAPVSLRYGAFIQTWFDFAIIAFAVFLLIKGINALKRRKESAPAEPAPPPADVVLLTEIRDLLKTQAGKA